MRGTILWRAGALVAGILFLLAAAKPVVAQEAAGVMALTGTLRKIHDGGSVTLGYRESSLPFSFLDARGQPIGYSLDLCREVVEEAAAELGMAALAVTYRPVTPETRIAAVTNGEVDLECGSTTATAERRQQVAFSPVFFIAGTKLLVRRTSPVRSLGDLAGKRVVVTAATTNEAALRSLSERQGLGIHLVVAPDHGQSFALLAAGEVDAFASDDVLLYGWIASAPDGGDYRVTGEYLSYDPYGIMYRRDDPAFTAVVERTFARLARESRLTELYRRWFLRRLPNGQTLNLPMSPQLAEVFRMLGEPD